MAAQWRCRSDVMMEVVVAVVLVERKSGIRKMCAEMGQLVF